MRQLNHKNTSFSLLLKLLPISLLKLSCHMLQFIQGITSESELALLANSLQKQGLCVFFN